MNQDEEKLKQSIIKIQNFSDDQLKLYRDKRSVYYENIKEIKKYLNNFPTNEVSRVNSIATSIIDFQELFIILLSSDTDIDYPKNKKASFLSAMQIILTFITTNKSDQEQSITSLEETLKKYEKLFKNMQEQLHRQDKTASDFNNEIEYSKKDINSYLEKTSQNHEKLKKEQSNILENFNKILNEKEKEVLKIKEEADNLKTAFKEGYKLKASRQYWASKKWNHFWKALFSFSIFIVIIFKLGTLYLEKIENDRTTILNKAPIQMYIDKNVTNLIKHPEFQRYEEKLEKHQIIRYIQYIFLLSLIIWLLRILLKVTFSNLHLQEEAHEKETMILTYLALINEGAGLNEDDRKLILEAIFRPSTNGLIKDESNVTLLDLAKVFKSK